MAPVYPGGGALRLAPASQWPIWAAALAALGSFPLVALVYYPALLDTGTLPTDADSIGIPIYSCFILTAVLVLPVLAVTALCIRRGTIGPLWGWRHDRPIAALAISLPFGGLAALGAAFIVVSLFQLEFWFDVLWLVHAGICVLWLLLARAAAISQLR